MQQGVEIVRKKNLKSEKNPRNGISDKDVVWRPSHDVQMNAIRLLSYSKDTKARHGINHFLKKVIFTRIKFQFIHKKQSNGQHALHLCQFCSLTKNGLRELPNGFLIKGAFFEILNTPQGH